MLNTITQKSGAANEEGFTLIELVITVAIIGILLAIGIPASGGITRLAEGNAMKASSQQNLKTWQARFIERGGTNEYSSANEELAYEVAGELLTAHDEGGDGDPEWGLSFKSQSDYSTNKIAVCFYTYVPGEQFGRGAGDAEAWCDDEG